jgi:alcohol dehydrogenase (cytochrome c)
VVPHRMILWIAALACAFATALTAAPQTTPPPAPVPLVLQNYTPVTVERLKDPEDGDRLMIRRTYDGPPGPKRAAS